MSDQNIINKKRYHPESHTAEHLLTQYMKRTFEGVIHTGSKIERKKSKVDFTFTRNITKEEIGEVNKEMNRLIQSDMEVKFEVIPLEEAKKRGFEVSKVKAETVRIVSVGDYDSQPCSGDHVSNTKEIGVFNMTTASYEDAKKALRVRFKVKKN